MSLRLASLCGNYFGGAVEIEAKCIILCAPFLEVSRFPGSVVGYFIIFKIKKLTNDIFQDRLNC